MPWEVHCDDGSSRKMSDSLDLPHGLQGESCIYCCIHNPHTFYSPALPPKWFQPCGGLGLSRWGSSHGFGVLDFNELVRPSDDQQSTSSTTETWQVTGGTGNFWYIFWIFQIFLCRIFSNADFYIRDSIYDDSGVNR